MFVFSVTIINYNNYFSIHCSESNSPFSPRSVTNANNTNNKRYNKKTTTTTITTTSAITTPDTTSTPISFRNNTTTNTNIFNFNSPENQQQKETMKSPSLKAKMALKRIRCLATRTVSINSPTTTDNYEKNTSKNVSSSKRGASATEDFQTRPLPPLPISPEFQNHHHRQNQYHPQDSPFRMHSLFNTSLDASFHSSSNTSTSKLKYQELEDYLQKNSSHPDLLSCSVDFTSKRKNTLSEFRKHRSTYNNKNRRKYVATELQKLHENNRIGNLLARQRSNSIDERFSEASLKRKRKQTRRSRSMDDLLDNVTVNQLYVDIKSVTMATTAYEEVPENLKQHRHQEQQKQRPKKPPRLFYESYHSHCNQQRQQEMWSPRDGGLTVSTNTLIGGENEYARITDLPPPSLSSSTLLEGAPDLSHKQVNIQQRPMPPTPTLLDMCFMKQNPANNTYTAPTTTALSSPQQKQRHATTAQQQTVHESEGMSEETASSIVISNMVALTGGDSKLNSDDAFVNVNDNRASTFIKAGHYKKPKPAVTSPLSLSKIPTVGGLGCPPHISPLAASRSSEDINEHNYSIRERRHLSAHFPSFRSSMSGSSGTYAKIPDLLIADLPGGGWTP